VDELALVLRARRIPHQVQRVGGLYALLVHPNDRDRGLAEIQAYAQENRNWPPPEFTPKLFSGAALAPLVWCVVLIALQSIAVDDTGRFGWFGHGRVHHASVRAGEWWRAWTGLTLHVDTMHLLSNVGFGALFVFLLAQLIGTGLALFAILTAGALGNLANSWARIGGADSSSVGASTAVFAAIGLLTAYQWRRLGKSRRDKIRRWAPILGGASFLGYLGASGERTDVLAHVTGLVAGFAFGLALTLPSPEDLHAKRRQLFFGSAAALALAVTWFLALR